MTFTMDKMADLYNQRSRALESLKELDRQAGKTRIQPGKKNAKPHASKPKSTLPTNRSKPVSLNARTPR